MSETKRDLNLVSMQDKALTFSAKRTQGNVASGEKIIVQERQITVELGADEIRPENINRIGELALEICRLRVTREFIMGVLDSANNCRQKLEELLSENPEEEMKHMGLEGVFDREEGKKQEMVQALAELEQLGVVKINDSDDRSKAIDIQAYQEEIANSVS